MAIILKADYHEIYSPIRYAPYFNPILISHYKSFNQNKLH